jgi:hypothetical protein
MLFSYMHIDNVKFFWVKFSVVKSINYVLLNSDADTFIELCEIDVYRESRGVFIPSISFLVISSS